MFNSFVLFVLFDLLIIFNMKAENDTTWKDFRVIEAAFLNGTFTMNETYPLIHLMYPNTALQARYSDFYTFRIQLSGTTTYTLVDPDMAKNLYPFPSIHTSTGQLQVS